MKISISDKIRIEGAPIRMIGDMKAALTLPNPTYLTLLRRVKYGSQSHKCLYAVKKDFKYYEYDSSLNLFCCGRGLEERIKKYCQGNNLQYELSRDLVDIPLEKPIKFNGELRDYQVGVPEEIIKAGSVGTLKLGTGYGKTIISCEIIRLLNKTALIIVPRLSILSQFKETLEQLYDYSPGIIQGQTCSIKDITVASMATIKRQQFPEIYKNFSIVISDEAHAVISDKGIECINRTSPSYLYGLTATPRRTDEQGDAIFFTFGPILIDRALPQKTPTVHIIKSNVQINVSYDYAEMIEFQIENDARNQLIIKLVLAELEKKRKILILTKRIKHYKRINGHLDTLFSGRLTNIKRHEISSDTKQSDRDELLTRLRNNEEEFDIILGTFSMLSTGVDIPALDTLIIAGDLKSSVLAEQSSGRILRLFEGKQDPKIIDIDDNLNPILHKQAVARKRFYKDNKWEIS